MTPEAQRVTARPSPRLRPFIDRYVGYRMTGLAPGSHRGLPSRHLTFIISIGPPIDVVAHPDPAQPPGRYRCVLSGLAAGPAVVARPRHQEGVAIELSPLGCRALFRLPAGALWSRSVECSDVAGAAGRELWDRLQGLTGWPERFAACDAVLTRLADPGLGVSAELGRAWRLLVGSGGTVPVARLAGEIGWSRQHLTRRFRDEFGPGPKLAARVVRLERARQLLSTAPGTVPVARIAAACGYYDQAHLDADFTRLAGCPPTTWRAEEVPSFQDDPPLELPVSAP